MISCYSNALLELILFAFEFVVHNSDILNFIEHPLLWSDVSNFLEVLEESFDDCFIFFHSFLTQLDGNV